MSVNIPHINFRYEFPGLPVVNDQKAINQNPAPSAASGDTLLG